MAVYTVYYPNDPDRVKTIQERLDASNALDAGSKGWEPEDAFRNGFRIRIQDVQRAQGEQFEVMEVSDGGDVSIWTNDKVYYLNRHCNGIEKLNALPRNPPSISNR